MIIAIIFLAVIFAADPAAASDTPTRPVVVTLAIIIATVIFAVGFGLGYAYRSRLLKYHRRREPIGPFWFR
jgi:hypothetical protein